MKLFGLELTRTKSGGLAASAPAAPNFGGGWFGVLSETFAGAFQAAMRPFTERDILAVSSVYACISQIAQDIAKLDIDLKMDTADDICVEVPDASPYWAVLIKPNHFQTRIQFFMQWFVAKLLYGNTYVLKQRDQRGIVTALYVLDSRRVQPLITNDGDVYYQISAEHLAGVQSQITVPASEIIHDIMVPLFHPLVGVSPLFACAASATLAGKISSNSTKFFENMSRPSGVLSAPGVISAETANRIKEDWQTNFSGNNVGKTAVLGDGINYLPMTMPAEQAQLIEQLKWTTTDVARCFHVPMFKLGDPLPHGSSIQAMNLIYWTDCLQVLIESAELCLTEGLGLTSIGYEVEFDLDGLLRMDTVAQVDVLNKAVAGGWMSPDEARQRQNMAPVAGGATPYMQQQNYSLAALAKRDAQADPFANVKPAANEPPPPPAAKSKSTKDFDYVASFGEQIINQLKDLRAA